MPVKKKTGKTVTETRIVEAAVQLFAQNGFKGASTRDIARLARVNEVTLFRYFPHMRACQRLRLRRGTPRHTLYRYVAPLRKLRTDQFEP